MKVKSITPKFVTHLPEELMDGVLYISEEFATAAHTCCCGCREEVITPLNPANWKLIKSGSMVSLHPSIGNWKFACKSHYWIRNNQVIEAQPMSQSKIEMVIRKDRQDKDRYITQMNKPADTTEKKTPLSSNQLGESSFLSFISSLFKK